MAKNIRISIRFPRSLAHDLKLAAKSRGGSINELMNVLARQAVLDERRRNPIAFKQLSPAQSVVYAAIKNGAWEIPDLAEETGFPRQQLKAILSELQSRGAIRVSKRTGKTEVARGVQVRLYLPIE